MIVIHNGSQEALASNRQARGQRMHRMGGPQAIRTFLAPAEPARAFKSGRPSRAFTACGLVTGGRKPFVPRRSQWSVGNDFLSNF
jgi:hypothetical protein